MMMMYPTEIWIACLAVIGMFLVFVVISCIPYIPHILARFTKKKLLMFIDKGGNVKFKSAKLKGDVYEIKKDNYLFYKKYPGSYRYAGVDVDFVHADRGFVLKPEFQAAIAELKEQYDINTYNELKEAIEEGIIQKESIEVPLFFSVPFDELIEYGAEIPPTSIMAQVDDMYFVGKSADLAGFLKWMPYIVIFMMIAIGGALAYKIMT